MKIDEIDKKILLENFDKEIIQEMDVDNATKILKYLNDNDIYYAKDLLLNSFDLFLLDSDLFIEKFEKLKNKLGSNYVEMIACDISLIQLMYN